MATVVHKDIRIPFSVGGRQYEAVGFLDQGEPPVDGDTMLARVHVISYEDETIIITEYRDDLPAELRPYLLVMGSHGSGYQRVVSCAYWVEISQRWCYRSWYRRDNWWNNHCLVVRRA